jgi:ribosome biogenesis GTPase
MSARTIGRVVRADARVVHVDVDGEVRVCAPRGKLFEELAGVKNPVAVGDRVVVSADGDRPGIEEVLPRANWLSRVASAHDPREQVLFANVDRLVVVEALGEPGFSSNRADRILAACRRQDIPTALVLNKKDLDRESLAPFLRATYEAAGVQVLETRAAGDVDLGGLPELLHGRITAVYGASGVGKSSLLNALEPGLGLKVGKISKYWSAGKHTTTFTQMHRLASGGYVIDTPGIRVFRLHGLTAPELRALFPELVRWQAHCRFPDCSHDHEPGCAVFEAVERGELAPTRFASYLELLDEIQGPREPGSEG